VITLYELTVYADPEDHMIGPDRIARLLKSAESLGGEGCPLDFVPPAGGDDPQEWGLRIRIEGDD